MPWKIDYLPAEHLVLIVCSGDLTIEDLFAQTREANQLRAAHDVQGFLADFTQAEVGIPLADIYQLPDYYAEVGVPRQSRIAVVFPLDFYQHDKYEFYEDVCLNRGYYSRLFDNLDQARSWLADND